MVSASLPLKTNCSLGESRPQALQRLMQIERRLSRNLKIRDDYCKVMKDQELQAANAYYMPHHCVIRALPPNSE